MENYFLEKAKTRKFDMTKNDNTIALANSIIDAHDWSCAQEEVNEVFKLFELSIEVDEYDNVCYEDGEIEGNWEDLVLSRCEFQTGRNAFA